MCVYVCMCGSTSAGAGMEVSVDNCMIAIVCERA